jgi:hypothetical protein
MFRMAEELDQLAGEQAVGSILTGTSVQNRLSNSSGCDDIAGRHGKAVIEAARFRRSGRVFGPGANAGEAAIEQKQAVLGFQSRFLDQLLQEPHVENALAAAFEQLR